MHWAKLLSYQIARTCCPGDCLCSPLAGVYFLTPYYSAGTHAGLASVRLWKNLPLFPPSWRSRAVSVA